jgi:hypothetical protein
MVEHNPWDKTIWDPIDPEQAIEDPIHGPSKVRDMLQTPAMPMGDGTYYQPGAFYTNGTGYVDSQGRPVLRIGGSFMAGMREALRLQKWVEAHHEGEEALTTLEAKWQQECLEKTGFAHCYKLTDGCPGGKKLENCDTGNNAFTTAQEWAANNTEEKPNEGTMSTVLAWAGGMCAECAVSCGVAVKTHDGEPRETRVSFYKPAPDIPTIELRL